LRFSRTELIPGDAEHALVHSAMIRRFGVVSPLTSGMICRTRRAASAPYRSARGRRRWGRRLVGPSGGADRTAVDVRGDRGGVAAAEGAAGAWR
jgi:hypothetical protein